MSVPQLYMTPYVEFRKSHQAYFVSTSASFYNSVFTAYTEDVR